MQLLRDKFRDFARETGAIGQERVDYVNAIIDQLIDAGHSEAATIAEWKDGLNEMWADLLELIDTRMQLLATSYDLHRYFYTGTEILGLIDEKHRELPEDVALDASTAESFHRVHTAFERELHLLGVQVPSVPCCPPAGSRTWSFPRPTPWGPEMSGPLPASGGETSRMVTGRFHLLREATAHGRKAWSSGFQTYFLASKVVL